MMRKYYEKGDRQIEKERGKQKKNDCQKIFEEISMKVETKLSSVKS